MGDAAMTIKFKASSAATAVNTVVHGIIAGIPMPFNVPEGKACETGHIKPGCPLTPGQEHAYDTKLPVSSWYPSLRLNVRWQLQDENGSPLVCIFLVPQPSPQRQMAIAGREWLAFGLHHLPSCVEINCYFGLCIQLIVLNYRKIE